MTETFICPGCRTEGEHKCHDFCICSDCIDNKGPRFCECQECRKSAAISKFKIQFGIEQRKWIYDFLNTELNKK